MRFKIKKTVNGETVWEPIKAKKYTASKTIEYTGTLPITITADGNALLDYKIYGNTVQNGTPTPETPIMPTGCGVRTGNLFNKDNTVKNYYLKDGVPTPYNLGKYALSDYIPIASNTATISAKVTLKNDSGAHWAVYDENKSFIRGGLAFTAKFVPAVKVVDTSGAAFIRVDYATESLTDCMLNLGSTAPPYEPYGYKLPMTISDTNTVQTVPVYIGEVETTRRIKKLVLTGDEDWIISDGWKGTNTSVFYIIVYDILSSGYDATIIASDKFLMASRNELYNGDTDMIARTGTNSITIRISDSIATTVAQFKSYLQQQYAAGIPVTVWYVLAKPETGIVNEPLMKIGDYADTLSMEQADVSIPTFAGTTVIDYDGTPKPSEMYVKYNSWNGWSDIDNYKMVNENWTQEIT